MGDHHIYPDSSMDSVPWDNPRKGYALSGKIMLSAIVILFAVVVFMVLLHIYARWYLLRVRRRQLLLRRSRRQRTTHLVFYVDNPDNPNSIAVTAPTRGLDASVLSSLPVFVYSSKTDPNALECAVCLSEFEESEKGRLLPKCNHSFHIDCIDMWFQSHSTCPICRSSVDPGIPVQAPQNRPSDMVGVVGQSADTEPGSSSGYCSACQHEEEHLAASTSVGSRRKGLDMVGVTIEVPRRNESEDELGLSSPASQGFKSPGSRLLSLKRILSMNRRTVAVSPSAGVGTSCGPVGEDSDIERGMGELTQEQTRVQTPR